jgi:general secretion pathway protein G
MQTLRNRLARSFARAHRGMTLLEIMIVLAIIALVMGLLVGPRVMKLFGQSKVDITKLKLNQYANEAFPEKLTDLNEYMNSNDANDAWGRPLKLMCPPPAGAKGIGVSSMGEDGKEGSPDDLKSWE